MSIFFFFPFPPETCMFVIIYGERSVALKPGEDQHI